MNLTTSSVRTQPAGEGQEGVSTCITTGAAETAQNPHDHIFEPCRSTEPSPGRVRDSPLAATRIHCLSEENLGRRGDIVGSRKSSATLAERNTACMLLKQESGFGGTSCTIRLCSEIAEGWTVHGVAFRNHEEKTHTGSGVSDIRKSFETKRLPTCTAGHLSRNLCGRSLALSPPNFKSPCLRGKAKCWDDARPTCAVRPHSFFLQA